MLEADQGHWREAIDDGMTILRAARQARSTKSVTVPELPLDPFTDTPVKYQKTVEGYIVYSLGANGEDDGGSTYPAH